MVDTALFEDIFDKSISKDAKSIFRSKCEDYSDDGFRCVTYYQCKNGRVVFDEDGQLRVSPDIQLDPGFLKTVVKFSY
jgi:hypothetical protein